MVAASQLQRWFQLALACLALLVGGPAAQALPQPDATTTTAVLRRSGAATRSPSGRAQPTRPGEDDRFAVPARRPEATAVPCERPPPGPDLFLLNLALLR